MVAIIKTMVSDCHLFVKMEDFQLDFWPYETMRFGTTITYFGIKPEAKKQNIKYKFNEVPDAKR